MNEIEKYEKLIRSANDVTSYSEALEVINAYDNLGGAELDSFLYEYVRLGFENEHLESAFEDTLLFNDDWLFKVVIFRTMFQDMLEYGPKALLAVELEKLLETANELEKAGNYQELLKILDQAIRLDPDNEALHNRRKEVSGLIEKSAQDGFIVKVNGEIVPFEKKADSYIILLYRSKEGIKNKDVQIIRDRGGEEVFSHYFPEKDISFTVGLADTGEQPSGEELLKSVGHDKHGVRYEVEINVKECSSTLIVRFPKRI